MKASAWKQADKIFQKHPQCFGMDVASSIDLKNGKILWLFGDTFVVKKGAKDRRAGLLPRNTIGIQKTKSLTKPAFVPYWRRNVNLKESVFLGDVAVWKKNKKLPSSFFAEEPSHIVKGQKNFFWPIHGIRVGGKLFIFMMATVQEVLSDPFGFNIYNWRCAIVDNPDQDPLKWKIRYYEPPKKYFGVVLGVCAMEDKDYVYVYGVKEPGNHSIYLARWSREDFYKENFKDASWWCGAKNKWRKQSLKIKPKPVFTKGHTELSVHYDKHLKKYIAVQNMGRLGGPIGMRMAKTPQGPWSEPVEFFSPPERKRKDAFVYAAKAHPLFSKKGSLVVTYLTNTLDVNVVMEDMSVYWPRFVKVDTKNLYAKR